VPLGVGVAAAVAPVVGRCGEGAAGGGGGVAVGVVGVGRCRSAGAVGDGDDAADVVGGVVVLVGGAAIG